MQTMAIDPDVWAKIPRGWSLDCLIQNITPAVYQGERHVPLWNFMAELIHPGGVQTVGQGVTPAAAIADALRGAAGFYAAEPAYATLSPCRTAFEAWAASAGADVVRWEGGGYFEDATNRLWSAWKAARVWADANQNTASAEPEKPATMRYLTTEECRAFGASGEQNEVRPIIQNGRVIAIQTFAQHASGWREPRRTDYGTPDYQRFLDAADLLRSRRESWPTGKKTPRNPLHHKEGEHVLYKTGDPDCPDAIKDRNGEVVLHECRLCGGAEATMPTQCPGVKMTAIQQNAILHGFLDFDEGTWLVPA